MHSDGHHECKLCHKAFGRREHLAKHCRESCRRSSLPALHFHLVINCCIFSDPLLFPITCTRGCGARFKKLAAMKTNHLYRGLCPIPLTCLRCQSNFSKSSEFDKHLEMCNVGGEAVEDDEVMEEAAEGGEGGDQASLGEGELGGAGEGGEP
jgi:hypothetical protein